jgi:hypothetical protein
MLYDHLPSDLRNEIYEWLKVNAKDERKEKDSDEQFFYKTRKKALGPFKQRFWDLDDTVKAKLAKAYDEKFEFLFRQLAVNDTAKHVKKYVNAPVLHRSAPKGAVAMTAAAHDDAEAGE